MAQPKDIRSCFEELVASAHLDVLLPRNTDVDVALIPDVSRVPARRNLFFDENATILVVLKTSATEEQVRDILPKLDLILAAHATDAVPQGSGNTASASGKHDLNTKAVAAGDFKDIATTTEHTCVVWEPYLHLSRPHARLQRPAIYFTAKLAMSPQQPGRSRKPNEHHLVSFEPLPANVLEPLSFGRAPHAPYLYVSESNITKVAPRRSDVADAVKSIRGATRRAFPVVPALFTRIRYSMVPDGIIASLHLQPSHLIAGSIRILKAEPTAPDTHTEDLTHIHVPLELWGGDETVLLYRLVTSNPPSRAQSQIFISVMAEVILDQGSRIDLQIDWQAQVDLNHKWQRPLYRWSRPATVSSHHKSLSIQSLRAPSMDIAPDKAGVIDGGMTFIFTKPLTVHASLDFKLSVHCNNRSLRSRRFGIMIVQPRNSRLATQSITSYEAVSDLVASVFSTMPPEHNRSPDIIDLNPDIKIGPLAPSACFEARMSFRALRSGILDLGTLRIVDLDTRQMVDVRELPDIVALANSGQ